MNSSRGGWKRVTLSILPPSLFLLHLLPSPSITHSSAQFIDKQFYCFVEFQIRFECLQAREWRRPLQMAAAVKTTMEMGMEWTVNSDRDIPHRSPDRVRYVQRIGRGNDNDSDGGDSEQLLLEWNETQNVIRSEEGFGQKEGSCRARHSPGTGLALQQQFGMDQLQGIFQSGDASPGLFIHSFNSVNTFLCLQVVSNGRVALENLIKYGILISPLDWLSLFFNSDLSLAKWPNITLIVMSNGTILLVFITEKLLREFAIVSQWPSGIPARYEKA